MELTTFEKTIPHYLQIVRNPIDLSMIKKKLLASKYQSEYHFLKEMRMVFSNSSVWNKVKPSKVSLNKLGVLYFSHRMLSHFKSCCFNFTFHSILLNCVLNRFC